MPEESKSTYAVLGILSIEPMSGYDIRQTIERSIGNFWNESYGQIYPILRRLVADDLATCEVHHHVGKPARHVYTLTDKGWDVLHSWLGEPITTLHPTRNEFLLKLFFGRHGTPSTNQSHVQHYRDLQMTLLGRFEAIEAQLMVDPTVSDDLPYWLITLRHGQHLCRALLAWCDETLATLHELGGGAPCRRN